MLLLSSDVILSSVAYNGILSGVDNLCLIIQCRIGFTFGLDFNLVTTCLGNLSLYIGFM